MIEGIICDRLSAGFGDNPRHIRKKNPARNNIVLHNINFHFAMQGISIIAGANGTGKSLLLHLLCGLETPQHGSITINMHRDEQTNHPIKGQQKPPALLMQHPILLSRSVKQNLLFVLKAENQAPRSDWDDLAMHVLTEVGLVSHYNMNANMLSGGERRLLNFARILLMARPIWLLDEPTAMLWPAAKQKIEALILKEKQAGRKIIMVTHEAAQLKKLAANQGDNILFLRHKNIDAPQATQHDAADFFKHPPHQEAQDFLNITV